MEVMTIRVEEDDMLKLLRDKHALERQRDELQSDNSRLVLENRGLRQAMEHHIHAVETLGSVTDDMLEAANVRPHGVSLHAPVQLPPVPGTMLPGKDDR